MGVPVAYILLVVVLFGSGYYISAPVPSRFDDILQYVALSTHDVRLNPLFLLFLSAASLLGAHAVRYGPMYTKKMLDGWWTYVDTAGDEVAGSSMTASQRRS